MTRTNTTDSVDDEIYSCLDLDSPKSFFLFAGAGSGKTRSLVEVLKRFRQNSIHRLRRNGQKVAVITYTNAACDEIKRRLNFDSAFNVSTIHSFSWELIKPHQQDIKEWLRTQLNTEISELEAAQLKGRAGTKAAADRSKRILSKKGRLESLNQTRKFTYDPNGDNSSRDSLNHAEVINITADFLMKRCLMQSILVLKYPVLLIDESQDTKKELIDAFFNVQKAHATHFSLGLFGDTMQRIYTEGKTNLGQDIPDDWTTPSKTMNYRCPKRVITLINRIRADVDRQTQDPHKSDEEGYVRLFIADTNTALDKTEFENAVCQRMASITGDELWNNLREGNKTLTLEHHMAALRGGFSDFFIPIYSIDRLKTGLLDGSLPSTTLFVTKVLPLIKSKQADDQFSVSRIVHKYSPLLAKEVLKRSERPQDEIDKARQAVNSLYELWDDGADPMLISILKEIYSSELFHVPDNLIPIAERRSEDVFAAADGSDVDPITDAWDAALKCRFSQFEEYVRYISDQSRFGTHQGIKGLEYPRVMVILDDEEARGFLFSYDKLFGAREPSATDKKNEAEGKETSIDRTRRLFYVTCSRTENSLAIIAYTKEPDKVRQHVISQNWFSDDEVICDK
ncbi:MAG: UvrD-helicase domain-containing protein [Bacteroidota bacterium]